MRIASADGWITFPSGEPAIQAKTVKENVHPTSVSIQWDVSVALGDGRTLIESFMGIGSDRRDAENDAASVFSRAVFHVLYKALYDRNDLHQLVEEWSIAGVPRSVIVGDNVVRGDLDTANRAVELADSFDETLKASALKGGLHWIRTFYAQMNNELLGAEVLLDNEPWPELETKWRELPWPRAEKYYSVRRFLIVTDRQA